MDYDEYLKTLEDDKHLVFLLQSKYRSLLSGHMKMKKPERDATWDKTRSMLFHIYGACSLLASSFRSYVKDDNNGL